MKYYFKIVAALTFCSLLIGPSTQAAGEVNFFNVAYTGTRNDFTGNVGYEFTPAADIIVTALGRPVSGTMVNNHTIKIWKVLDESFVASVVVTPSSATDPLGYKYVLLSSSVTLTSGTVYRISSSETDGGDTWWNVLPDSINDHLPTATISGAVYGVGDTYPSNGSVGSEYGYVAPTFYTGGGAPPAALDQLKIVINGVQIAAEYTRATDDVSPAVAETSTTLGSWLPVAEEPTLLVTSARAGTGFEKITIQVTDAAARRFFRLRDEE